MTRRVFLQVLGSTIGTAALAGNMPIDLSDEESIEGCWVSVDKNMRIIDSYNVDNVIKLSAGQYKINLCTSLERSDYAVVANSISGNTVIVTEQNKHSMSIASATFSNKNEDAGFTLMAFK